MFCFFVFFLDYLFSILLFVSVMFFFFFKQMTAYELRISDWSSDVCSSDLDGVRVRASAGSGSYRRKKKLRKELKKARRLVALLKQERDDDPEASNRRLKAARVRAAREREERVAAALDKLAELEAERARRSKTNKAEVAKQKEPRASTSDPQARVMKMADGGFRPAYNCQVATGAQGPIGVDITEIGRA